MRSWWCNPHDGISVLKRAGEKLLNPHRGHRKRKPISKSGRKLSPGAKSASTLTLDFSASRIVQNKCLLFNLPVYGTWYVIATQAKTDTLGKKWNACLSCLLIESYEWVQTNRMQMQLNFLVISLKERVYLIFPFPPFSFRLAGMGTRWWADKSNAQNGIATWENQTPEDSVGSPYLSRLLGEREGKFYLV